MTKLFKFIVEVLFIVVVVVVVGYGVYLFFNNDQELSVEAKFTLNQRYASSYYGRIGTLDGLCSDIALPSEYVCASSDDEYRIYQALPAPEADFWCIDSTGFNGRVATLRRSVLTCQ